MNASSLFLLAKAADHEAEHAPVSRAEAQALRIAANDARREAEAASGYGTPETLAWSICVDNDRETFDTIRAMVAEHATRSPREGDEVISTAGMHGKVLKIRERDRGAPPTIRIHWQNGNDGTHSPTTILPVTNETARADLADALKGWTEEVAGTEGVATTRKGEVFGDADAGGSLAPMMLTLIHSAIVAVDWHGLAVTLLDAHDEEALS